MAQKDKIKYRIKEPETALWRYYVQKKCWYGWKTIMKTDSKDFAFKAIKRDKKFNNPKILYQE